MGRQYVIVLTAAAVALAPLALLSRLSADDPGPPADPEGVGEIARSLSLGQDPGADERPWTAEEHALFLRGVERFGPPTAGGGRWRKIASVSLEGQRSTDEVHQHWRQYMARGQDPKYIPYRPGDDTDGGLADLPLFDLDAGDHATGGGLAAPDGAPPPLGLDLPPIGLDLPPIGLDHGGAAPDHGHGGAAPDQGGAAPVRLRVVSWNVGVGKWATPEQIADALRPLDPDVVLLSEAPRAIPGQKVKDWSRRLANALGLIHVHVGKTSTARHKALDWMDVTGQYGAKFKAVLSRTPLSNGADVAMGGGGWNHANAVRVETEIGGRKFAIYSLHLPGYGHQGRQPILKQFWEKSQHKDLANHINAEDASYNVVVGGDFNEWTGGLVMRSLLEATGLEDAAADHRSIDHLLYSTKGSLRLVEGDRDWGPEDESNWNAETEGHLSDHPFVWGEFEISDN